MTTSIAQEVQKTGKPVVPVWVQDATYATPRGALMRAFEDVLRQTTAPTRDSGDTHGSTSTSTKNLTVITFADGKATNLGPVTPQNFHQKWEQVQWGHTATIMPGFNEARRIYQEQYQSNAAGGQSPVLVMGVCTSGNAEDIQQFEQEIRRLDQNTYLLIALTGAGTQYADALRQFEAIATDNPRISVLPLGHDQDSETMKHALQEVLP